MESIVLIVHVILSAGIVVFVLLQQGKGAEAGASFGAGASQTVFGSTGSGNFLSKMTSLLAVGLFATSFVLAVYASDKAKSIGNAGIPSVELVEQGDTLPVLESTSEKDKPATGVTDIPKAD